MVDTTYRYDLARETSAMESNHRTEATPEADSAHIWPSNTLPSDSAAWPHPLVVRHPSMLALYDEMRNIATASARTCILILGETGVGKDVLARSIHAASARSTGPFVAVNCPAIVDSMFEREMFGHRKGTFTNATTDAAGYFEAAEGGTLFLDEIGELRLEHQAKLLRILDDRRVTRIGDTQSRLINVRIIAATNKNLEECVAAGTFRRDLYYRLRGFVLRLPPLRARRADIIALAEAFLADECRLINQGFVPRLSPEVIDILDTYDFPGNVRELRTAMAHALAHCRGNAILPVHLPPELRVHEERECGLVNEEPNFGALSEKDRILRALHESGGSHVRAAALLGISKRTLYNRLDQYEDIPRPRKSSPSSRPKP